MAVLDRYTSYNTTSGKESPTDVPTEKGSFDFMLQVTRVLNEAISEAEPEFQSTLSARIDACRRSVFGLPDFDLLTCLPPSRFDFTAVVNDESGRLELNIDYLSSDFKRLDSRVTLLWELNTAKVVVLNWVNPAIQSVS